MYTGVPAFAPQRKLTNADDNLYSVAKLTAHQNFITENILLNYFCKILTIKFDVFLEQKFR
jgi:hypothetical protein